MFLRRIGLALKPCIVFGMALVLLLSLGESTFAKYGHKKTPQNISTTKAKKLSQKFLIEQSVDWGDALEVKVRDNLCNVVLGAKDKKKIVETWDEGCIIVTYPTDIKELGLLGHKAVLVKKDGSKIGFAPRD
jgi:hypothetical protein